VYGQRAQLQEYSAPLTDVRAQREWRSAMHAAVAQALEFPLKQVVLKQRHGQRPDAQYRRLGPRGGDFIVGEGGHRFIVNVTEYLDTGLFLDHRQTRARCKAWPRAGAFSICSAIREVSRSMRQPAGAKTSTSVDLSNTYLDWARRNSNSTAWTPAAIGWFRRTRGGLSGRGRRQATL